MGVFCAEPFLGSPLILFINITSGTVSISDWIVDLLSHTFTMFGTRLEPNKMHCYCSQPSQMFLWKRFASWQHPFQSGKQVTAAPTAAFQLQPWGRRLVLLPQARHAACTSWAVPALCSSETRTFNPGLCTFFVVQSSLQETDIKRGLPDKGL